MEGDLPQPERPADIDIVSIFTLSIRPSKSRPSLFFQERERERENQKTWIRWL
jgi:hypothetical protein